MNSSSGIDPTITPDGNKIIWHGPHLDAALTLSVSPVVQDVIFFQMQYPNMTLNGQIGIDPALSPDIAINNVVEMISQYYMQCVFHDFNRYKEVGGKIQ